MLHRSSTVTLAGQEFRLWFGFSTFRRLGLRQVSEFVELVVRDLIVRDENGRPVDARLDTIESMLWAGLHKPESPDGKRLEHCGLSKAEVAALIDETTTSDEFSPQEILAGLVAAIDQAVTASGLFAPPQAAKGKEVADEGAADPPASQEPMTPRILDASKSSRTAVA